MCVCVHRVSWQRVDSKVVLGGASRSGWCGGQFVYGKFVCAYACVILHSCGACAFHSSFIIHHPSCADISAPACATVSTMAVCHAASSTLSSSSTRSCKSQCKSCVRTCKHAHAVCASQPRRYRVGPCKAVAAVSGCMGTSDWWCTRGPVKILFRRLCSCTSTLGAPTATHAGTSAARGPQLQKTFVKSLSVGRRRRYTDY